MFTSGFQGAMQPSWPAVEGVRRSSCVHTVHTIGREMLTGYGGPRLICAVRMEHVDRVRGEYYA